MTPVEVVTVTREDSSYPSILHGHAWGPDKLYAKGNLSLLRSPSIGLCGSRNASKQALLWARCFGIEAAKRGVTVVSGYARGVDVEAHRGALEAGGTTIAILPEGIDHFHLRRDLKQAIDFEQNFLALSMFEPSAGWTVWRAMGRNKLIVALASGLFVIEARDKGGTIEAAYEAIRQKKKLWAVAYDDKLPSRSGNRRLLAASALPLSHVEDFRVALEEAMREPPPEVRQLVIAAFEVEPSEGSK